MENGAPAERMLRVIVSIFLWAWSSVVAAGTVVALAAIPDPIDAHMFRYSLQIVLILIGAVGAIASVVAGVWRYVNQGQP